MKSAFFFETCKRFFSKTEFGICSPKKWNRFVVFCYPSEINKKKRWLKKPQKTIGITVREKEIDKKEIKSKLSFKFPKKKPTITGVNTPRSVKISKYYNKKDFSLAKKAISEMKKSKWPSALKIAKKAKDNEAYIILKKTKTIKSNYYFLSKDGSLKEAAKNLYSTLRKIKNSKFKSIAIKNIPNEGLGETINDRLLRASKY